MSSHLILLLQARHARRTTGFTVLELMIVVGVFSVLLAIMLPVFRNVREASSRVRAKVEATALAQAVIQYKNIYGYWPGMVTETGGQLQITPTPNKPAGYINWPLVSHFSNTWFKVHVAVAGNVTAQEASYIDDNTLYRSLLPFDTRYLG